MSKGKPIPVRFEHAEADIIEQLHRRTKLTRADIVRRAIRLLDAEAKRRGTIGFILDLEAAEPETAKVHSIYRHGSEEGLIAAEEPPPPNPKPAQAKRAAGK